MCCGACRRPTWRRPPTWCGPTSEGWRGICGMRWASTALHASGWLRFIWKGDYLRSRGGGLARLTWAVPVGCAGDEGDCDEVRRGGAQGLGHCFLSCLRGSEPVPAPCHHVGAFLSCLRGSERRQARGWNHGPFLSCLRGSELQRRGADLRLCFLSCLRGSERHRRLFHPRP